MTRRLLRACWCAALLAPLGLAARSSAKPPDLPLESQNDVRPQLLDPDARGNEDAAVAAGFLPPLNQRRPADATPVMPIRIGTGQIALDADPVGQPALNPADTVFDEMCEPAARHGELLPVPSLYRLRPSVRRQVMESVLFGAHPLLALLPTDKFLDCAGDHPQAAENAKPACPRACPGMRPAERHVYQFAPSDLTQDLLHNLEKLEAGHRLMHLAEHLALSGRVVEALDCFDIVCRMCPGRFEAHIGEIMAQVFSPVYSDTTEEAEDGASEELPAPHENHEETRCPSACPKCERLHAAHAKGVAEQVEGLMQACRLCAEAGRHAKAAELARQAYALDAERVMADPLVYKMHLLALKRDKGKARHRRPDPDAATSEPSCPRGAGCPTPTQEPTPPPVDDGIIGALEQVLEEAEALPEEAPHHSGVSLHGCHFDVDCSWTGLRMQGHVPLRGSLYTVQYWNGALSGWVTPGPSAR